MNWTSQWDSSVLISDKYILYRCFQIDLPVRRLNVVEFVIEASIGFLFADPTDQTVRKHCEKAVSKTGHHGNIKGSAMFANSMHDPGTSPRRQIHLEIAVKNKMFIYLILDSFIESLLYLSYTKNTHPHTHVFLENTFHSPSARRIERDKMPVKAEGTSAAELTAGRHRVRVFCSGKDLCDLLYDHVLRPRGLRPGQ